MLLSLASVGTNRRRGGEVGLAEESKHGSAANKTSGASSHLSG